MREGLALCRKAFGLRFLALALLAHGVLAAWQGFYWDDWTPVLVALMPGSTWREFLVAFARNRPLSGLLFWALMHLPGPRPWAWHLLILGIRGSLAWAAACLVARLWPHRPALAWWTGVLLALYPAFRLQPISVAFTPHLLSLLLWLVSLLALWQGWQAPSPAARWRWWLVSWMAVPASLLLLEYYVGLEVARWGLLAWLSWKAQGRSRRSVWGYVLPYVLLLALSLVLIQTWSRPAELATGRQMLLRRPGLLPYTLFYLFVQGWFPKGAFRPETWQDLHSLALLAISGVYGLLLAGFVRLLSPRTAPDARQEFSFWPGLWAGVLVVTGLLPLWLNGRFVGSLYSDRFLLPALPPAALLMAFVLEGLPRRRVYQALALLPVVWAGQVLFYNNLLYMRAWQEARAVYQQLYWRVPAVRPGTLFVGEGALAPYIAEYVVGESLNALYRAGQKGPRQLAYWHIPVSRLPGGLTPETPLVVQHKHWRFQTTAGQVVFFLSRAARRGLRCVWVLTPEDRENPYVPEAMRASLYLARANPIQVEDWMLPPSLFGVGPGPRPQMAGWLARVFLPPAAWHLAWCYYFEKAELARSRGKWAQVARFWQAARQAGVRPVHVYEYRPFILAFGHLGKWEQAAALSVQAWQARPQGGDDEALAFLCHTWRQLREQTPPSLAREQAWARVGAVLQQAGGCAHRAAPPSE